MKKSIFLGSAVLMGCTAALMSGCAAPQVSNTNEISPDSDPLQGGLSSADIRTVASQMCPSILAVPEISGSPDLVRIKIAGFSNKSRFFINNDIFMKRLTVELNRYGRSKVRFLNNDANVQANRYAVLKDRQSEIIQQNLKKVAAEIAASPIARQPKPVKIAVIPVLNTNLINMNADSFAAMLRSEIVNAAAGKLQFLMPEVIEGADYYLTGQFIPETMKTEGIINLANYINIVDKRVKSGQSITTMTTPDGRPITTEKHLLEMLKAPEMRANPNVNKRFNIMLVDAKTLVAVFEKMILLDRKVSDNSGAARYIISGEINGMHQRKNGVGTDYLMITVQLTDPESNETIWEDAYEVKRFSQGGIVYR